MDKNIKGKWIKALRSGEYKQGIHSLRDNDCFCCLGVLCDVIDNGKWNRLDNGKLEYDGAGEGLPVQLLEDINLSNATLSKLIWLNDVEKASFQKIADWIEKWL